MAETDGADAALPGARYAAGVARGAWQDDSAQHAALAQLDRLHRALLQTPSRGWLDRLLHRPVTPPRGLYLWGGVGRGKTFLIDLFFDGLPIKDAAAEGRSETPSPARGRRWPEGPDEGTRKPGPDDSPVIPGPGKRRTHFHRFMREVHAQLREHAGQRDPLAAIARRWRNEFRVLVLDEFFVVDIGDAMLLGRLLERLFAEGIALVTSSNIPPRELFKDGLQRARFLPAIAHLELHCKVLHLDSAHDYRLRALTRSPVYRAPLDDGAGKWLQRRWEELTTGAPREDGPLRVNGRRIPVRGLAEGHAWFDFAALCDGPRAASDYIEIATEYHTVLVGGVPRFDGGNDDPARRFVTAIDEFYDRHVNLVCTAAAAPAGLYTGHRLTGAFERTASRLVEMQSAEYLALEHRG